MTMRKVTHIRMATSKDNSVEKISRIKFEGPTQNGEGKGERDILHVIQDILRQRDYYCVGKDGSKSKIEIVSPAGRNRYIRSARNHTENDNLLNLPRF